jgi:hypothetical protein
MAAHILPAGGASTLRSLTKLARPVEGSIVAGPDGVSRITTRGDRERPRAVDPSIQTVCVQRYRVLSPSDAGAIGTAVEGEASLRGLFVSRGSSTVGVAAPVAGALGPLGHNEVKLVAFSNKDQSTKPCAGSALSSSVPGVDFSTQTALMALAPQPATLKRLGASTQQLLVACANGVYVLQALPRAAQLYSGPEGAAVLHNLVSEVRYVVDGRPAGQPGGFLCRLARDTIAALPNRESSGKAVEIQKALRSGPYRGLDEAVHSGGNYIVSRSLLEPGAESEPSNPSILRQAAESALGPNAKVYVEPLVHWQTPPVSLDVALAVSPTAPVDPAASTPVPVEEKFLLHGGRLGLVLHGSRPTMRPLQVGEEPGSPERQFSRVLSQTIQEQLGKLPEGSPSQDVLDAATRTAAAQLRERLGAAGLFGVPVEVRMSVKQLRTPGMTVSLPSGLSCIVPDYALDASGPRISAVTGALPSLGAAAVFVPWSRAEVSGVALG